jgi:unsaturated rhamnogalacturonyl hydrolase
VSTRQGWLLRSIAGSKVASLVRATATLVAWCVAMPSVASTLEVGLGSAGTVITATSVLAADPAAPTLLLIGGLNGDGVDRSLETALRAYERRPVRRRAVNVIAIARANPDGAALVFPPPGAAYRDHPESHALWRFMGAEAPDLVVIAGDDRGLEAALAVDPPAGVGRIPSRRWLAAEDLGRLRWMDIGRSEASTELARRLLRSPRDVATQLATIYGRDFAQPTYINALALVARLKLGQIEDVRSLVEPYVDGRQDSLARPNSLTMAGHVVFTELARVTDDARYVAAVRRVADLGFEENGAMRESMPYHNEFSDSIFMGATIAAQAGALSGDRRYFDAAVRHVAFMQRLVLRSDGLYRHQPATDAAWGRGNAFAAIGLALTLDELPREHAGHRQLLQDYRAHMAVLLGHQTTMGLWRNVVDYPGSYAEYSATAMIAFAIQRGLNRGWIEDPRPYRAAVANAWRAVKARTGADGTLIDVCESTARIESLQGYLAREALLGRDARGGAMAMLLATELMD